MEEMDMKEGELYPRLKKKSRRPAPMRRPRTLESAPRPESGPRDAPFPWWTEEKNGTQPPVPAQIKKARGRGNERRSRKGRHAIPFLVWWNLKKMA